VMQETGVGAAALEGHVERTNGQVTVVHGADSPAHDEP
jgi:hypothetical protein